MVLCIRTFETFGECHIVENPTHEHIHFNAMSSTNCNVEYDGVLQ